MLLLKHLYLLLLATFVMGVFSGAFVYFISRGPIEAKGPETVAQGQYEIVVDMYGGCELYGNCESYRIQSTGNYVLVERDKDNKETRMEGKVSKEQVTALGHLLSLTDFSRIESAANAKTCAPDTTGYRYDITYQGEHIIDSCKRDVTGWVLFQALNQYFDILKGQSNSAS